MTASNWLVVHVIDSLGRSGGAEQQLVSNLRHFADRRLRHHVLCLYPTSNGREHEVPTEIPVSYLSFRRHRQRLLLALLMWRRLAVIRPDLIHCALPDAGLAARLAGRWLGIPVVESLVNVSHEQVHTVDNPSVTPWKLASHRLLDSWTMRGVAGFQALSQEVARSWVENVGINSNRITIIPRGVEPGELVTPEARATTRRALLEELTLAETAFVLVNVGRQVPQKGQRYLIAAMEGILAQIPEAALLLAGSPGSMTPRLRELATRLGVDDRIHWLGVRNDVPRLLAAADLFLFPSLYEGLGVSLLQAMAAGVACITTDRPPMSELIVDGDTGLLVLVQDPDAIARAVIRLRDDPELRHRIAERGRLEVLSHFGLVDIAAQIEAFYRRVLQIEPPLYA